MVDSNNLQQKKPYRFLWIILPLCMLIPFSMDFCVPSLPAIADFFHASSTITQMTVTTFMIGAGLSQIIYGPISDKYGRKPAFFLGISIYILATIACVFSPSIYLLVIARLFQAVGACAALVTAFAITRDLFPTDKIPTIFAGILGVICVSPAVAPILGGILQQTFGWQSIFIVLLAFSVLLALATLLFLPETNIHRHENRKLPLRLFKSYLPMLKNLEFLGFSLSSGFGFSVFVLFIMTAPFFLLKQLGLTAVTFGYYFAIVALAMMLGCVLTSWLTKKHSSVNIAVLGCSIMIIGSILWTLLTISIKASVLAYILPMALIGFGIAIILPTTSAGAILPFPKSAATSTALFTLFRFILGSFFAWAACFFFAETQIDVAVASIIFSTLSLGFLILGKWLLRHDKSLQTVTKEPLAEIER